MNHANTQPPEAVKLAASSHAHNSPDTDHDDDHDDDHEHDHALNWREINRVLFVAAAAGAIWYLGGASSPLITGIGVVCTLVGGFPIFHEAYENIVQRRMTMELSMAIAIVAALAIREIFTALVITLFVLVAEILEGLTAGRGRKAIQRLVDLLPNTATVRRNGAWTDVDIAEVSLQDAVLVKPGGRIPVDGQVVGGHSFVDQAPITGESMPVEKQSGASVYAGTINQSGALELRIERLGRETTFGKIIEAVETAEKSRAPIQGIADRLAGYLVYFALGAAVLTFLISHNIRSTISVVIVAGACGIAAGTPLAILGSIGRAAQQGAIIKGGLYLEKLGEVDTVLLDKTGTLTFGTPEVLDTRAASDSSSELLLQTAAIAESRSEHPIAKAILRRAAQLHLVLEDPVQFHYTPRKRHRRHHCRQRRNHRRESALPDRARSPTHARPECVSRFRDFRCSRGPFLGDSPYSRYHPSRSQVRYPISKIHGSSHRPPHRRCQSIRGRCRQEISCRRNSLRTSPGRQIAVRKAARRKRPQSRDGWRRCQRCARVDAGLGRRSYGFWHRCCPRERRRRPHRQ